MVLALLGKAILTGKVAVMRNVQAQSLHNRRALFEIHHIVFIGVLCEKFLIFDQCLNFVNRFFYFFFSILFWM